MHFFYASHRLIGWWRYEYLHDGVIAKRSAIFAAPLRPTQRPTTATNSVLRTKVVLALTFYKKVVHRSTSHGRRQITEVIVVVLRYAALPHLVPVLVYQHRHAHREAEAQQAPRPPHGIVDEGELGLSLRKLHWGDKEWYI